MDDSICGHDVHFCSAAFVAQTSRQAFDQVQYLICFNAAGVVQILSGAKVAED